MVISGQQRQHTPPRGFTLVEVLITLTILATIAVFAIPKVLDASNNTQNAEFKRRGKQAASMIQAAYSQYRRDRIVSASMNPADLTPYMDYVSVDTVTTIDNRPPSTTYACNASQPCLVLKNGSYLNFLPAHCFGGTSATNLIFFAYDPDGKYSGNSTGPGKAVHFVMYYNGKISTVAQMVPGNTDYNCNGQNAEVADPAGDPDWFSWN